MEGLEEWKALPGDRGNLADKEPEWVDLLDAVCMPAEVKAGEGKEKEAMAPTLGSAELEGAAEELSPQTGSLLRGSEVEMVKAKGAAMSGVEADRLARLPK